MYKKIIILMAALLLVLVGISCGGDKPTEEGGIVLKKPDNKENIIDNPDGMLRPDQLSLFDDTMVNVRLIADSGSGAYYRAPVIITYGGANQNQRKSMAVFMEKRYGAGGVGDVGVDGNAKTDIIYMANDRGGDSLDYSKDYIVGKAGESANTHGAEYSRASAVVFVHSDGINISVVAAAGTGNMGTISKNGSGKSEVKISKGTASGSMINFNEWKDLNITYNSLKGSDAILEYAKQINDKFNAFYTRWGQGKVDGQNWILPLKLMERKSDNSLGAQAVLVLYSENEGGEWKFGPYLTLGVELGTDRAAYNEATGLSVIGNTFKVALVPRNPGSYIGIARGTFEDCSSEPKVLDRVGSSSFVDSYNNFEMHSPYFINTRERSAMSYNSFIVNKKLTIAILSDPADNLQEQKSMMMSRVSGSGSVAVLADNTIVTIAEEAFAENSTVGENRYNLVQRRFTRGYVEKRDRIADGEEYFNPNLEAY